MTLWLLASLLWASTAVAQLQSPARQRQDRRVALPATADEPVPEVRVAAGNLTTLVFNSPLDRDTLEVDRTRFKLVDTGERSLALEPATELGVGERLVVKVRFKDKALPAQAVIALVSHASEMDGKVEVDRRANSPEALLAALAQRDAELEALKVRCEGSGPVGLVLSEWLNGKMVPVALTGEEVAADASGLKVLESTGYPGAFSAVMAIRLRNLSNKESWAVGLVRISHPAVGQVQALSVRMRPTELAPGETGWVVAEINAPLWEDGKPLRVELVGVGGQRRLSLNLSR